MVPITVIGWSLMSKLGNVDTPYLGKRSSCQSGKQRVAPHITCPCHYDSGLAV
ncbi:hypothetical protein M378DRAFT_159695 [Amanita muscaria Koide BX008]|uniref:Uncharacterized protein n=1 Tax=Amanita muscaria (strain Koide BX008) TaxID=946122 RepID=A0A0C2TJU4_AMAMK|nr:hypothetical protein M378DRAFT_159695 [Amanita muscaria Koide BX008]